MIVTDMSNEDYHAEAEHLSSTTLKRALPELFKEGGSQEAMDFGTFVHSVVLEPETLNRYTVLDAAKIGVKADGTPAQNPTATSAWKNAVMEAIGSGLTIVTQESWDKAHRMADAIYDHPEACSVLCDGEGQNELSVFTTDANGQKIKARYDRLIPGAVVDLKTTNVKPGADSLTRTVLDYGYDLSAAHYLDVADLCEIDADTFLWVFVSKDDKPRVTVCEAHPDYITRGRALRDRAIARINDPEADPYEGASGRLILSPPPWARIAQTAIPADFTWSIYDHA